MPTIDHTNRIQLKLAGITVPGIASAIGVSLPYAADIRAVTRRPPTALAGAGAACGSDGGGEVESLGPEIRSELVHGKRRQLH
jgi:hypothetical protein